MLGEQRWYRSPSVVFAVAALAVVVVAELIFARGSGTPSDFSLFLGRFHPLVVHLPIGVLVLVGLAEAATFSPRFRERVDPALGLALPVLVLVTVTAFVLGHFLGRSGGFAVHALTLHRRFEFVATAGVCISLVLYARQSAMQTPVTRNAYRGALFATLTLLSVGAHFGGSVTHGDSYLTEYAPGPLKSLLGGSDERVKPASSAGAPKAKLTEPLVFDDVVRPLLGKYCVDCHGPKKQKGKLRLDSLDAVLKGGEDGPAAVAGSSPTSELVKRVKLPPDDDDRMPPEGKPGPTPEELAVIAFWIDRGASPTLRVRDTLAPANGRKLLEAALAKAPSVPGAVTSAVPRADAKDAGGSGEEPAEKAPHAKTEVEAERNEKGSTKGAAPAAEETSAEKTSKPSPAKTETPSASSPSGPAVLAERCEKCHGSAKKKGDLRVDSLDALLAGGEQGPAVVPGDPDASEIVRRVRRPLATKGHMPPKKEPQPSDAEISALAAWVRGLSKRAAASSARKPEAASKAETLPPAASPESPATSEPASDSEASAQNSETTAASSAGGSAAASSPGDSSNDDAPADAELLARVPERIVLYEQAVRPLLAKRCGKCHSGAKPAARFRIDDYATLLEGGLSGPGIVPGKPDESFVVQRIGLPASDDDHMPPEGEPPMTADEIALVRFWVRRGAARELELPSKDVPASPLRAAAEYVPNGGESPALRADAGCAACVVGRSNGSANALALAALAFGLFVARRRTRGDPS